jgi:hypothetical protein
VDAKGCPIDNPNCVAGPHEHPRGFTGHEAGSGTPVLFDKEGNVMKPEVEGLEYPPPPARFSDGTPCPPCPQCGGVLIDHPEVGIDGVWCAPCAHGFGARELLRVERMPLPHGLVAEVTMHEVCEKCGEPVPVGAWPYCVSRVNPGGHSTRNAYGWTMASGMGMWDRVGKDGR